MVESYRDGNLVRHRTILHVGTLAELPDVEQKRAFSIRINELIRESYTGVKNMFACEEVVEELAQKFFLQIIEKERLDIAAGKDFRCIDTDSLKNKDIREVGTEWLCSQALEQLGISDFLNSANWSEEQVQLALTHIISRAAYPASELRTGKWIKQNSAVCELTGYPREQITKDKLYTISKRLYSLKESLEKHLSKRTNELFDLNDNIIIYDLTNTYYEGVMRNSKIGRFGRSKEKRSDARLVVLAVVVNAEGFLKYSQIFEGNMADSQTLDKIITELSMRTSSTARKPTVVLDAGIATEDNLKLLRENHFRYMCVSRSGMNKYTVDADSQPVTITDKRKQPITLQRVTIADSEDTWLQVHSKAKALKESGMNSRFTQNFEQGLVQIKASLTKKGGVKKDKKVWERIGRLKQKYSRIHRHYEIETKTDAEGIVVELDWKQKPIEAKEGYYLLRTNIDHQDEQVQWLIYNIIREIEATFRVLKTDLDLRPIYHKTDEASMAHLHLGLLAYWVVNTIRYQLKRKGINNQWLDLRRIMSTQKMVTTTMEDAYQRQVVIRLCSEPTEEVREIYADLGYQSKPFTRKKSVVPLTELKIFKIQQSQASHPT